MTLSTRLTNLGNSGSPILEVQPDGTFVSIGVHCRSASSINEDVVLGHSGNSINAFENAIKLAENNAGVLTTGNVAMLRKVEVPLNP